MSGKESLSKIVGSENVFDDLKILEEYSRDTSFVYPIAPMYLVKPGNADEVQRLVKWANESLTPLVTVSSGTPHFRGGTVPSVDGATIVDLSRMNKIIRVDARNRVVMVEPAVTFSQLIPELEKVGLRLNMPLLPRKSKSVVGSMLEREPVTMPKYQWDIADPLACTEVIYGTGDMFRTGSAAGPGTIEEQWQAGGAQIEAAGPTSAGFYRLIQAAQGTMGIVTWATARCERLPEIEEAFMVGSAKLESLFELIHWLIRLGLADECLVLNRNNLATILSEDSPEFCEDLRDNLPLWILFFSIAGFRYFPEEKVDYQTKDMTDIARRLGLEPAKSLAGVSSDQLLRTIRHPSSEPYWKHRGKGSCHDIFFLSTYEAIPDLILVMNNAADEWGFPVKDIGVYLQPSAKGTSCHCEFNLFFDPKNTEEAETVRRLSIDAVKALMSKGAFFSRVYGLWSDMAYGIDAETTTVLRKIKNIFDPKGVLNPGKLCF